MASSELVMLTDRMLTPAEWQNAIDRQKFLVPLVLDRSSLQRGTGTYRAELAGETISFVFEQRNMSALGIRRADIGAARFAFATPGSGDLKRCAAGGMALWAYAAAAGGILFEPEDHRLIELSHLPLNQHLDAMLAAAFDREREYGARYPSVAEEDPVETMAIATLARR